MKHILLIVFLSLTVFVYPQILVSYEFDGQTLAPIVTGTNTTASNFTAVGTADPAGGPWVAGNPGDAYSQVDWPGSFEWNITADVGYTLQPVGMTVDLRRSGSGPSSFDVYESGILTFSGTLPNPNQWYSFSIPLVEQGSFIDYRIEFPAGANSSGTVRVDNVTVTGAEIVPVKLTSFTGELVNGGIRLLWTTMTESQNEGFYIERSSDGKTFSHIGFVAAQSVGNHSGELNYEFFDENPVPGYNLYRLVQQDLNGMTDTFLVRKPILFNYEFDQKVVIPFAMIDPDGYEFFTLVAQMVQPENLPEGTLFFGQRDEEVIIIRK